MERAIQNLVQNLLEMRVIKVKADDSANGCTYTRLVKNQKTKERMEHVHIPRQLRTALALDQLLD